jgi:hypothetical protein
VLLVLVRCEHAWWLSGTKRASRRRHVHARCRHPPHQDPTFRTAAAARWRELRAGPGAPLRDTWWADEVAALKRLLGSGPGSAGQRNWAKWGPTLNKPDYGAAHADWPAMFDAETKLLLDWTLARLKWLDAAFDAVAAPGAPADAYLQAGRAVVEPPVAGPSADGPAGRPAVAGR